LSHRCHRRDRSAHVTTGTARRCGPSQLPEPAQPLNQILLPSGTSWSDFGLPAMEALINKGYVIVATDYQGLGGPGDHQYAQTVSNGRDVINALRAARDFKPAQAGEKAIVYGWSQGGGATIGAAGQKAYATSKDGVAPIDILGFVAMAPQDIGIQMPGGITTEAEAAKLIEALNNQFSNNVFNFTHLVMMYWGLAAAEPELKLGDLLTPQATGQIDALMQRKCIHELSASFSYSYGNSYKQMLKATPSNALAWVKAVQNQSPGLKPMAPVVIYWGNQDDVVPPVMHQMYVEAA
jgi:pimeloyl-ACP methyl ester carboxylesterase